MDAQELAALVSAMPEAQRAQVFGGAIAAKPVPDGRPPSPRVQIWPKGSMSPIEIWVVDRPAWLAAGATLAPASQEAPASPGREPVVSVPLVTNPTETSSDRTPADDDLRPRTAEELEALDLHELKELWQASNPGEKAHGASGRPFYTRELLGAG